ncbi:hypothetical protein V8C40DRAFT_249864 [Trichoderma camerunense]
MCIAHTYVDVLCNTIPWLSLAAKSRKANIDSSNLDASPYGTVACKMYTRACCLRSFLSAICPASRLEKGGWARAIVPLCRGHVNHKPRILFGLVFFSNPRFCTERLRLGGESCE